MSMSQLGCALIGTGPQLIACADILLGRGHRVVGVISDCEQVKAWTRERGIARIPTSDDQVAFLKREPYDYLLSIVNHAITSDAILGTPAKGAINYHDSPLPEYAGFNATSWAIIDGKKRHGITWHEMVSDVDAGRIFVQRSFDIVDDDTAFTLGAKCGEAGIEAFSEVLDRMESGTLDGQPQGPGRSFHLRSERPGQGILDWNRPAAELDRLVRGLTFGPDDNWMCHAKVGTATGFLAVGRATLEDGGDAAPGTVVSVDGEVVRVATAQGVLALHDLAQLDGGRLPSGALAAHGITAGALLPGAGSFDPEAVAALDAEVTRRERFWVGRLEQLHAPLLPGVTPQPSDPEGSQVGTARKALPADVDVTGAPLTAAFVALTARLADDYSFDLGLAVPGLGATERLLYATAVPMHAEIDVAASFSDLVSRLEGELAKVAKRKTFALDVTARYGALRERADEEPWRLPVGLALDAAATDGPLPAGQALQLCTRNGELLLRHDSRALDAAGAEVLLDRLAALLQHGLGAPETPVAELPILSEAERRDLLEIWQQTACAYASDKCIHQLFEDQVERTPDKVAVVFRNQELTYRELNQRANRVAERLREQGVGVESLVGICVRRSLDMMVGLLGILKAGAAYVPLDPVYPRERLAIMLEDSKAPVLLTQRALVSDLPAHDAQVICIDEITFEGAESLPNPDVGVGPDNLAYVIFTSGSTGRPKGVMVQHGNVSNFFTGMDASVGSEPGALLAVTSICFDISVLELFWTLSRGFEVVVQEEADRATLSRDTAEPSVVASSRPMDFGLFYFAADSAGAGKGEGAYRLLLEGAKFADTHGFKAVWTPERHFHAFGGLYPNPAVTTAALAVATENVGLRAGSVVLPLHNPLRVAEDWSVIDNLSNGRVSLSFASGWHVNDFAFMPDNYATRREKMIEYIDIVRKLWRGESVRVKNGEGVEIDVTVLPRPVQDNPPLWLASAGNIETFRMAGRLGTDVLTNMLGQDLEDLGKKFAAYREARAEAGIEGEGRIAVMLHTYVCEDTEKARALAKAPFCNYLKTSFDLVKVAPWMFPAFRQPSKDAAQDSSFDPNAFTDEDMDALLDHAFDRYFDTAGLFGSPKRALSMVEKLKDIGATECACLIDFGIDTDEVLASLQHLDRLRVLSNPGQDALSTGAAVGGDQQDYSIAAQIRRRNVSHMQCTPSLARMLVGEPESVDALGQLSHLMVGGEAFPEDLRQALVPKVGGKVINMYGPTETTIWSTTAEVHDDGQPITIGRPIANTVIRILDPRGQLVPVGTPGELCIGGVGVVRGYLGRDDLTAERFVTDPYRPGERIYRTGDLARYRSDGVLEFLGRLDHQVKVNGYRIELGEIEAVLGRDPGVHQSVVVARNDDGVSKLVAYVVPHDAGRGDDSERVDHWRSLWDEAYRQAESDRPEGPEPRFDYSGWTSSYDGALLPRQDMVEWLDGCTNRILAHGPRRVLEVGCGTGMVLYRVLPHVEHYTGTDLSAYALECIERELSPEELNKVRLLNMPAHTLDQLDGEYDTVIINSVAQYFPSSEYLTDVLERVSARVSDGGRIFLGDVRSLDHEQAMATALELHQAPAHLPAPELRQRVERRQKQQGELLLSPRYFGELVERSGRLSAVEYELKRGEQDNEMTRFRYDVILHVGSAAPPAFEPIVQPTPGPDSLTAIRELLSGEPEQLWLTGVPNARLTRERAALDRVLVDDQATAQALKAALEGSAAGVSPEALYTLDDRYDVHVTWAASGDVDGMDVMFRHRDRGGAGVWPGGGGRSQGPVANEPIKASGREDLIPGWREHLRDYLPEYMMPSTFVVMDALPLTNNGKIDRKALPAPQTVVARPAAEYVAPTSDIEQTIARVWQEMLNVEQVGIDDNIFDLGANSLLTVQANGRLTKALGQKISLVSMFRFPTVRALAQHLAGDEAEQAKSEKQKEAREDRRKSAAERRREARARQRRQG